MEILGGRGHPKLIWTEAIKSDLRDRTKDLRSRGNNKVLLFSSKFYDLSFFIYVATAMS
jgi:hypothetical protein